MNIRKIAFCGVMAAVSMVLMFISSVIPFLQLTSPAAAGAMLMVVAVEAGARWGFTAYAAVGILSIFIVPDKNAALLFVAFMGYYPILKKRLDKLPAVVGYAAKLGLFYASMGLVVAASVFLFGSDMWAVFMAQYGHILWPAVVGFTLGAALIFLLYDRAVAQFLAYYIYKIQPRLGRRKF